MIKLVFIIFFYIKHLILRRRNKITSTGYVTASSIWIGVATSWIKFCWWIKTEILTCTIKFKFVYIFYVYATSINSTWSLLLPTIFIMIRNLRISPQYRTRFLIIILIVILLLLCLLFWSYLIHRFCAYSYSRFWLDFERNLFCIICYYNASISSILLIGYFSMLFWRIVWG